MPLIIPTNSISAVGYNVANSLRFDDGSSDHLDRTPSSSGNLRTWTFSTWVKRTNLGSNGYLLHQGAANNTSTTYLYFVSDKLSFNDYDGSDQIWIRTNRLFRDVSAWYHIVVAVDTTQATSTDRIKIYVNGVQESSFDQTTYPSQNFDTEINSTDEITIGRRADNSDYFDGYLAETVLIDGSQLDPTSFGEFDADTGIWKPIDVSGLTFGTNGFYLDFENSGSLGADVSGNGNNFTVNNLTSVDQSTDTPTNNYCTMNPLTKGSYTTLSEGNLKLTNNTTDNGTCWSTFYFNGSGKWYWEAKITTVQTANDFPIFGVIFDGTKAQGTMNGSDGYFATANDVFLQGDNTSLKSPDGNITITAPTTGDIIMFALDMDNGELYVGSNGTWYNSGDPTSGATGTGSIYSFTPSSHLPVFAVSSYSSSVAEINFGNPTFSISSGNSDANGYGNFEYSVPSGYYALNTKNLAEFG